jgi:hypothetical protein
MSNCQWFNTRIEAYFSDDLNNEELHLCRSHLAACPACAQEVESLRNIDSRLRQVFQYRLRVAQEKPQHHGNHSRVWKLAFAGVGLAAVVLALTTVPLLRPEPPGPPQVSHVSPPGPPPLTDGGDKPKAPGTAEVNRLKPTGGPPAKVASQPNLDSAAPDGPEFAVTDAAGYTATLDSYKGRILLFGLVSSEQKAAVANLQQIYEAFGANPAIRILGVAPRDDSFAGTTFPRYFNQGSKLMGIQEGEFLLIDAEGKSRLKGSLADAAQTARLRTQLNQLGIR